LSLFTNIEYRVVGVLKLDEDKYQKYASALVKTSGGAHIIVCGISPDGLNEGALWAPEARATFTALKPQQFESLGIMVPHIAQDPTTRASFPGKKPRDR
jgi:hypothetical protein